MQTKIPNGVMFNAYPDSIGATLSDTVALLQRAEFKEVFSLFYALPTFFNSDLDRGFSVIDYNLNNELVSQKDLDALKELGIMLKFDIVLNHLSVGSPQFKDLLEKGDQSAYKDFFINWNTFWEGNTARIEEGVAVPKKEYLDKLFMRKPGLPVLKVLFPDGTERPYWNTFYQKITYHPLTAQDLIDIDGITEKQITTTVKEINAALDGEEHVDATRFRESGILSPTLQDQVLQIVERKRSYLGQMDVNAQSEKVWDFYDETLKKVSQYGCKILRLDAFAYLHKEVGQTNFFNKPGTWTYLDRVQEIATKYKLTVLPEIHAEYGVGLHEEVASRGFQIYDFFFPGLVIHTLEREDGTALINWAKEVLAKGYKTVNMLGCHDGIPVLDLKGGIQNGTYTTGLLADKDIEFIIDTIMNRGGRVKNIYDPEGNKISYYQVNATFYSALGENDQKLLLARALQLFMPGIPQVWYLDIFAGTNDYEAADAAGSGGHKEINRTTLSAKAVESGLKRSVVLQQLAMMRLRNTSPAFDGTMGVDVHSKEVFAITWQNTTATATLTVNLKQHSFTITTEQDGEISTIEY